MKTFNVADHLRGSGSAIAEDPVRRERWAFLMENLKEECRGIVRTDADALKQRRISTEILLENALRCVGAADSGDPVVLDRSAVEPMYEMVVQGVPYQLQESTTTMGWSAVGSTPNTAKVFTTHSLGMVRRVFPRMIATDLISVQPMPAPTGKVFYMDIKYGTAAGGSIADGDRVDDPTAWTFQGQRDYASYADTNGTNVSPSIVEGNAGVARALTLDISSIDVSTETKKLGAEWSVEAQQDIRAYHGLDVEGELSGALAQEVTREIDRVLINFIFTTARDSGAGTTYWNKNGYAGTLPSEQKAWDETLFDAIEDAAADIEGVRYRRPTWLLVNHNTAARIRKLNGFASANRGNADGSVDIQMQTGARRLLGTLNDTYYVYVDPWFDDDQIILGYKGNGFFESGIVYSPYIPFYRSPKFTNPVTFMSAAGIMSRYAKTAVIGKMYARVVINAS